MKGLKDVNMYRSFYDDHLMMLRLGGAGAFEGPVEEGSRKMAAPSGAANHISDSVAERAVTPLWPENN
ncbi:MAG: hypothetical protein ABFS37_12595 [Acidobacteriota bacterium]